MDHQPRSDFQQTLHELDERFLSFFPAAKSAAQDMNNFFGGGQIFTYDPSDSSSGYTVVAENSQSRTQDLSISSPITSLHYDYTLLPENVAGSGFRPTIHDSDSLISQSTQHYTPTNPITYPGPSQIPSLQPANQHYTPTSLTSYSEPGTSTQIPLQHYTRPNPLLYSEPTASAQTPSLQPAIPYASEQHKYEHSGFDTLHRTMSPNSTIHSPIDALSPRGHAFTPDSPSEIASSPRSELGNGFQETVNRPFIPNQDNPLVNTLQVQFPEETKHLDRTANQISSPNPSRAGQHGYDNRHARSYHSPDKPSTRGIPWIDSHSSTRPSMRLSPLPTKRQLEKKPPLACLFCRGRKIACGPPLPGSNDKTCNQCQRRSLCCEYPSESRRGMRKKKTTDTIDKPLASSEIKADTP